MNNSMDWFFTEILTPSFRSDVFTLFFISLVSGCVVRSIYRSIRHTSKETGLDKKTYIANADSASLVPTKEYISETLGLAGRPDAIIIEDGFLIPVERKMSSKIRDRHVIQLLVYMKLIEEIEKRRPPYGYLILGKNAQRVKIQNTEEKQKWLVEVLQEMKNVLGGIPAKADPHKIKCIKCEVSDLCAFKYPLN